MAGGRGQSSLWSGNRQDEAGIGFDEMSFGGQEAGGLAVILWTFTPWFQVHPLLWVGKRHPLGQGKEVEYYKILRL